MAVLLKHLRESGFPLIQDVIHLFVGGSELHGAKVEGTDDLDIYGVYVEPPEMALGLKPFPHFVWSTAGDDRRNGPNDIDITLYSLRKWAGLACKGNPTALHFLFSQGEVESAIWRNIVEKREAFLAKTCVKQFLGFAQDQLLRMSGKKGRGKKGQRPELEMKHGYDVKSAMHSIRLLYECRELVTTGKITLPRPERKLLIQIRTGRYSMQQVLEMAEKLFAECNAETSNSHLPDKVTSEAISKLLANAYRAAWDLRGNAA